MPKSVGRKVGTIRSQFSKAVIARRKDRGLSQMAVASLAGVSVVRLSEIEGETTFPRLDTIEKVANALGIVLSVEAA